MSGRQVRLSRQSHTLKIVSSNLTWATMNVKYIWFGSERKTNKVIRRLVKRAIKMHIEPEPKYRTGKFWND